MISVVTQSLILAIMAIGVYITFKILDFPDMTADGSYTMGAAISAAALVRGLNPIVGVLLAVVGGALAGMVTGLLHIKVKISNLLSGILTMGMLYSINLRIMGKSNIPLFTFPNLFKGDIPPVVIALIFVLIAKILLDLFLKTGLGYTLKGVGDNEQMIKSLGINIGNIKILGLMISKIAKILLDLFLKTGLGYTLKGVGDNEQMIKSLGINIGNIKILGLMISNALISLSGALMAQFQGFADVTMGIGTLVLGIASIIIGLTLFKKIRAVKATTAILIGAFIYQFTIYFALNLGMLSTDLKLISSLVIVAFLAVGNLQLKKKAAK